ncbi:hypothetical protein AC1031_014938 [Aphanomyces cochlioides]|nr:hypothetical protein AC1031_014938 [Aphanomyces cochlioides]
MPYHSVKLNISKDQQKKALRGAKIRLTPSSIGQVNAKGGINLELSPGEIMHTAAQNGMVGPVSDMSGSGIFDSIWDGLKSAGKWLKDSGVGSALADVAQTVATPFVGPEIANTGRQILKSATGVGLKAKKKMKGSGLYL